MMFKKILVAIMFIATHYGIGMEHNQNNIDPAEIPKEFFKITPSLKTTVEFFLLKLLIDDPEFKSKFVGASLPEENKKIIHVADFISCASKFSHSPDQDIDFLSTALSPITIDDLQTILNACFITSVQAEEENQLGLVQCIQKSISHIIQDSYLIELMLNTLNNPDFQHYFKYKRIYSEAALEQFLQYLVIKNRLAMLHGVMLQNISLRDYLLVALTNFYAERTSSFADVLTHYEPDFLNPLHTSDVNQKKMQERKLLFFEALKPFYQLIQKDSRSVDAAHRIIYILLDSGIYDEQTKELLTILFDKGYTPNVLMYDTSPLIFFFKTKFKDLFSTPEKTQSTMLFILFLIENGFDISPLEGPETTEESLKEAQQNFRNIIRAYPKIK